MKANYYKKAVDLLSKLQKEYPSYSLGRHISTAFADYGDVWGLTDKEMYFALDKYSTEIALDIENIAPDEYVQRIEEDAKNLFNQPLNDEEEEDY